MRATSAFSGLNPRASCKRAATAMYAGPMPLSAIASARPCARTAFSVARSRFWSNHDANISGAHPLTGSRA